MSEKIVLKYADVPEQKNIGTYMKNGGYKALPRALSEYKPDEIIQLVDKSGLRGRGGAGFPTGKKWGFIPKTSPKPKYLVCNADEGEPGTFKDRAIIEGDPHLLIEGMAISSYAIGAHKAYIYIRGEFAMGADILVSAINQAREAGFLGKNVLGSGLDIDIDVFRGAGAYICGEETALLDSLEGRRGMPRLKPPFPVVVGLYASPTMINNVETLANIPRIIDNGAEWFAGIGTPHSTGTKIFCISGDVNKPGVYETPMGISFKELLKMADGIKDGKKLKAFFPGGSSTPILTDAHLNIEMDFESLKKAGSMLGSGAVIVLNEDRCMVKTAARLVKFYRDESCGKCSPCREGTDWLAKVYKRIMDNKGRDGDIDLLLSISHDIYGTTFCPLGDAATMPVVSSIKYFRKEYEEHINGKCNHTDN
ncbi:MAG: NADH-quinone oxidoreductase subunit NuoF [Candidatus Omnitrophica bacterium]|nr:NADH-quinone oxidoreductase subunit NuoF [Candidatus Omnitrophota bacterium]